ncbi:MAG TPA: alpha-galactosidase [Anaerolineae bacterium]|nr:alpha-galactosidase [Anaerolineae bacterium]
MAVIPNVLLKQLYVKSSLRNSAGGWAFDLANHLGAGTVTAFRRLAVDGVDVPPAQVEIETSGGTRRPASDTSPGTPLSLPANVSVTVHVAGKPLPPGKHRLDLTFDTREFGPLSFHVTDSLGQRQAASSKQQVTNDSQEVQPVPNPQYPISNIRPVQVAILGAGSTVFARQLMTDLLCVEGLSGTFVLVDIDPERLELAHAIGEKLVEAAGGGWSVEATADRARALPGCDYVLNMIEVAGLRNVDPDYEIPLKYGVDQCIGDTIGPGGIFKMVRTGPAWLDIVRDVERLCPGAVVMNYTNPMSALTLLALRATDLALVGLCHSVQGTSRDIAAYVDVPLEELRFRVAGINHLAWFTELTHRGEDLYPRLRQATRDPEVYECDPVRFEMMLHFGAFVTESSGHFSEYVPYFRKRPDLLARYTRQGYRGESGFYARNWPRWRREAEETVRAQLEGRSEIVLHRSSEYAADIVEAIETGRPAVIHGNVLNSGLIDNLPTGGCVEVPILVDGTGLHPTHFGPLPPQLAALDAAHLYVHELMVESVLNRDRQAALHALMLDPLTAAVLSPAEIQAMFDEMWEAERQDIWN